MYGNLSGVVKDIEYKNVGVFLLKYKEELIFINKKYKNVIIRECINKYSKLLLDEAVVLYNSIDIFNLSISSNKFTELGINNIDDISEIKVGYTSNKAPFFINHDLDGLSLKKSLSKEMIFIKNNEIKDIIINNKSVKYNDKFTEVEIRFQNRKIVANLRSEIVHKLMKDVFIYSKKPMLKNVSIQALYENWAKSMNDMILFNLFGNIYYMKKEIDNILEQNMSDEDKINIVNMLYYQIQDQKNQFDILAAYMPKAMEYGEVKLFKEFNVPIDKKVFRVLQKQIFGLTSQINRYLADIEKSLGQLSFVIYSEFNTREFSNKLKNTQVGVGIATSVASSVLLGGALAAPFLATQAISLYSNKKMDEKMKEVESGKLNLFTNQAISKLDHLVETMYPYYVGEANDTMFDLFRVLGKEYAKHSNDEVKEVLFDRIADIYVSKQIPLNNMTNMRKKDLINDIYKSIDSSITTFDANVFLIGGIN